MTIRKFVSLYIQNEIMEAFDDANSEGRYSAMGFHLEGETRPTEPDDMPFVIEFDLFQERPNTFAYITTYNSEEVFQAMGWSKCIGAHKGNPPDKWDAREGVRIAQARAAKTIGKYIEAHENAEEEEQ